MDGTTRVARLMPESPTLKATATPSGGQVVNTYFWIGVEHISLVVDHLLFVLGLLLIVDTKSRLIKTITSFKIAHSINLVLSAIGLLSLAWGFRTSI